jgi:hypothetical protein
LNDATGLAYSRIVITFCAMTNYGIPMPAFAAMSYNDWLLYLKANGYPIVISNGLPVYVLNDKAESFGIFLANVGAKSSPRGVYPGGGTLIGHSKERRHAFDNSLEGYTFTPVEPTVAP